MDDASIKFMLRDIIENDTKWEYTPGAADEPGATWTLYKLGDAINPNYCYRKVQYYCVLRLKTGEYKILKSNAIITDDKYEINPDNKTCSFFKGTFEECTHWVHWENLIAVPYKGISWKWASKNTTKDSQCLTFFAHMVGFTTGCNELYKKIKEIKDWSGKNVADEVYIMMKDLGIEDDSID